MKITKFFFHIINLLFLILYLYPGSILGFLLYRDFYKQPQVTSDFAFSFLKFSSNHVYAFAILTFIGLISYLNKGKIIIIYFIFLSVFLELSHLIIPNRSFQFDDLFGNIIGVLISVLIIKIYNFLEKK
tara:strand:+ start:272 stop:658 length:387 start_codon:yes stop_codon:yes gene_type:complete